MGGLILLTVLTIGFVFLSVGGYQHAENHSRRFDEVLGYSASWVFGILATIWLCCLAAWLISYPQSVSTYGKLEGIRDSVITAERIAKQTKDDAYYVTDLSQLGLENFQQSGKVSESLENIRQMITEYNIGVRKYMARHREWFIRLFIASMPEDLKPIVVRESILK